MERLKIIKLFFYFLGIILLGLGITLTLISDLGAGGWDALVQNLSYITGISIGKCLWSIAIALLILSSFILKKLPDIKVLIVSWITGEVIDIFYYIVLKNIIVNSIYLRFFILGTGLLCIALGCSMMFITNLPKNHTETLVFSIVDKFGYSYKTIKIFLDSLALVFAIGIGFFIENFSNIGIGTFISSFFMGYLIDKFLPITKVFFVYLENHLNKNI